MRGVERTRMHASLAVPKLQRRVFFLCFLKPLNFAWKVTLRQAQGERVFVKIH